MFVFKCKCYTHALCITMHCIRHHFTMRGWERQDGNGSGHEKLSLVPSRRRRQNTFLCRAVKSITRSTKTLFIKPMISLTAGRNFILLSLNDRAQTTLKLSLYNLIWSKHFWSLCILKVFRIKRSYQLGWDGFLLAQIFVILSRNPDVHAGKYFNLNL